MPLTGRESHQQFWADLARYGADDVPSLMAAEKESRQVRVEAAFLAGASLTAKKGCQQQFDQMWLGEDLDRANAELFEDLGHDLETTKARKKDPSLIPAYDTYNLGRNTQLISFYYCFSSKSGLFPGRLSAEAEELLQELLWWRTLEKNDIAMTRRSTWWMAGSENHDLNTKTSNLLVSAILMESSEYASRVLLDQGYGCAPGYMKAGFNPATTTDPKRMGTGRADWSDGKDYVAADHYKAWVGFLKEYLRERVRKGFFLENGAPGYMRYTISYLLLVQNFCPDDELRELVRMFLDLFWIDWALQQLGGLRGGPKTRHHKSAGGYDAMSDWARFYLGGPGLTSANYSQQLLGDYAWPRHIWETVLDREGLGSFEYVARGIGEEEETCPRPPGVERTMMGDRESRMVKYSWVTPDYVLGTQMDHPLAVHNHLSAAGRWQGLITADPDSRITTVSLSEFPGKTAKNGYSTELMYHSAQHLQVLITQQRRRWIQINPDWFPAYEGKTDVDFGVFIGSGWENRVEKDGWLFLEQDDTFAAIRIIRLKADPNPMAFAIGADRYAMVSELEDASYTWNEDLTILQLINKFSPIIVEAGRRADYPTLADFEEQILSNKLEIHRTVNTRETRIIVVYKGVEADEIVFNGANPVDVPTIGGELVNYSHPKTFDAPYLQSEYDSGVVKVGKGDRVTTMDFNSISCEVEEGLDVEMNMGKKEIVHA